MTQANKQTAEVVYAFAEKELYTVISRSMSKALGDDFITPAEMLERIKQDKRPLEEIKQPAPGAGWVKAEDIALSKNKPFFIDTFSKLLQQFDKEEISMSKFVECLNLDAINWHLQNIQTNKMKKKVVYLTQWVARDREKEYLHGYGFYAPVVEFPQEMDAAECSKACAELSNDEFECIGATPVPLIDGGFEILGLTPVDEINISKGMSVVYWNMARRMEREEFTKWMLGELPPDESQSQPEGREALFTAEDVLNFCKMQREICEAHAMILILDEGVTIDEQSILTAPAPILPDNSKTK